MAPPRAPSAAACPDRSPPGAAVSSQSPVSRAGTTTCGASPAPSDLECRPDPRPGRPRRTLAPHHSTPAASLPAAPPPQTTAAPSAREAPRGRGEGRSSPPHCGEALAWSGTPGLGTPERRPAADQPSDGQADETRHPPSPAATPTAAPVALIRTVSPP